MSFITHDSTSITLNELFNQQHASIILAEKAYQKPNFDTFVFHNVGIKIMKDCFDKFSEHPVKKVKIVYDWNTIMKTPHLVCYDKNTWKTLQQLANWNREWSQLFNSCYYVSQIDATIICSWGDDQFVKAFLEGIAGLANIKEVKVSIKSKNEKIEELLKAFKEAKIFGDFKYQFNKM